MFQVMKVYGPFAENKTFWRGLKDFRGFVSVFFNAFRLIFGFGLKIFAVKEFFTVKV